MNNYKVEYMPINMFPDCHNQSSQGEAFTESNPCACKMSDGSFEICTYIMNVDFSGLDRWVCSPNKTVEGWIEL